MIEAEVPSSQPRSFRSRALLTLQQRSLILFMLGAVFVTPLWATSSIVGLTPFLLLPVLVLGVFVLGASSESHAWPQVFSPGKAESALVAVVALLPSLLYLLLTWRQEFPFVGDHDYHLVQSDIAFGFWSLFYAPIVILFVFLLIKTREPVSVWLLVAVAVVLPAAGYFLEGSFFFAARYPGTFYFIVFPLKVLARISDWDSPLNALRLANFLSIPAWLFLLRPLVVRRWPDRTILPFAVFFFYQKDIVYYFTASYLEPWSLVIVLTAVEYLLLSEDRKTWVACILVGSAALIKEQAILILPFAFAACWLSNQDRPSRNTSLFAAICASYPFVLYYLLRNASLVWRKAGLADAAQIADPSRLHQFANRGIVQFGPSVILVFFAIAGLAVAAVRDRKRRPALIAIGSAALFQILFFYTDRISVPWTGYPRFHLFPILLFGGFFIWVGHFPWFGGMARLVSVSVLCAAVNLLTLAPFMRDTLRPDVVRNFIEHSDSPIYFPVNEVLRSADGQRLMAGVQRIRLLSDVNSLLPKYELKAFPAAYPRIAERFRIGIQPVSNRFRPGDVCRCRSASEANLALHVYFTNLAATDSHREPQERQAATCDESLALTCAHVVKVTAHGKSVAALGIGLKQQ